MWVALLDGFLRGVGPLVRTLSFVLFIAFSLTARADACRHSPERGANCSVLLVHSYHPSMIWVDRLSKSFNTTIRQSSSVRIDVEFLDAKRRPSLEHGDTFLRLLRQKYAERPPDVLVISDDPAFDLMWPVRDELFPQVPVVFMGLNSERDALADASRQNVTGIYELHDTKKTVELALALTQATGMIVLNDTSETGLANEGLITNIVESHPSIEWVIERDMGVQDIQRLTALPADWPILAMLPLREAEPTGPMLSKFDSIARLREALPNPLFYDAEWWMGSGLVGGYSLSSADHARQAGELVLAILRGADAGTLPIRVETESHWVFDQRELDRFNWTHAMLPEPAVFLFGTESFFAKHREAIFPLLVALLVAMGVIALLIATLKIRHRSERLLMTQKIRLSAALDASDAGVFEMGPQGHYASDRWLALTSAEGAKRTDDQTDWLRSASEESRQDFLTAVDDLKASSGTRRLELNIESTPPRILDVLITRRVDNGNHTGAIVGVATDITTQRQYEEEAARRNRFELFGELAGSVAHDINNFLLTVRFGADMAKKIDDADELKAIVGDISLAGQHTRDSLRQILSFGHRGASKQQVIDLNAVIRDIVPFLKQMAGPSCEVQFVPSDHPLGVCIDRAQLESVLSNLIVNARDAIDGSGSISVTLASETVGDKATAILSVRDNGVGMSEAVRQRVFEPFFSTKPAEKGTGLGLSTVYRVVRDSGGRITVDSVPDVGTVFELIWPLDRIKAENVMEPAQELSTLDGKTILLVEDDPLVGAMTQKALEDAGSKALLAVDGRAGLELFSNRQHGVDLVLSDVMLPHMNGIDMVSRIREIHPAIKVGFLSGSVNHASLRGATLPDDAKLLKKPFSCRELQSFASRTMR